MKVLIACEESQRVCIEFRKLGHEAYSCDIVRCSGGHPEWHILSNALSVLGGGVVRLQNGKKLNIEHWDLIIAHPPCTYLSNAATSRHSLKATPENQIEGRTIQRIQAMDFFMRCIQAPAEKIAVENPVGIMNTAFRAPDQIIEPYMFANDTDDAENYVTKRTCLWLKGLPKLKGGNLPRPDNAKLNGRWANGKAKNWTEGFPRDPAVRSKTFPGVARAMAKQWSIPSEEENDYVFW
jgi:hypothetical protein